jgi:hypothetical protein
MVLTSCRLTSLVPQKDMTHSMRKLDWNRSRFQMIYLLLVFCLFLHHPNNNNPANVDFVRALSVTASSPKTT